MVGPIRIAIDAMGGDHGISSTVPAAIHVVRKNPGVQLILVGNEAKLNRMLRKRRMLGHPQIKVKHASEEVEMDESPSLALRNKKDSSMRVAINMVKDNEADACVSAGNTGALMATSRFVLKMIAGVDRPAIVYAMPGINQQTGERGTTYMLDLGANVDCTAEHLFQFAVMGSVLCQSIAGIEKPRVALLNIGEEEMKGLDNIKEAAKLLSNSPWINYVGFVEGNHIFAASVDVIVCDGFIGNVALKTAEGVIKFMTSLIKGSLKSSFLNRICKIFALPILLTIKKRLNVKSYNGASFLGLKGVVIKSHGGADAEAFSSAIEVAIHEAQQGVPNKIRAQLESILGQEEKKNVSQD
jgi:glycerol-3-phosphate acyltransferase PlsX